MRFIDEVNIVAESGKGGDDAPLSYEIDTAFGGPNGGDGGKGEMLSLLQPQDIQRFLVCGHDPCGKQITACWQKSAWRVPKGSR